MAHFGSEDNQPVSHFIIAIYANNPATEDDPLDQLKTLRTFISVADHASFAEAGRRLNMSPTAVTRTIAALEASLGVQLLMRTTRSVRLTDEGAAFLERTRAGVSEIDQALAIAQGSRGEPSGLLTVTAPVVFGRLHILPVVTELLQSHPDLRVRLLLLDRVVHMVEEGVDVAVRIADLPDSALHMVRIGEVRRLLSASPAYLERHGVPSTLADLERHQMIAIEDELGPQRGWATSPGQRPSHIPRLTVNSVDAAIVAAIAGAGIVRTLSYQVAEAIVAGRLQQVLAGESPQALPVSLLFQAGRRDQTNIRAFVEVARRQIGRARL